MENKKYDLSRAAMLLHDIILNPCSDADLFLFNEEEFKRQKNKRQSALWKILYVFFSETKRVMDDHLKDNNRNADNITQDDLIFLLKYIIDSLNNITKNFIT